MDPGRLLGGCVGLVVLATACSSSTAELTNDELTPPAAWNADEQQVIETYATFRSELTEATRTKEGDLSAAVELASPRLAEALVDNITADRSVGNLIEGRYDFAPLSVTFASEDAAQILTCAWDQTYVINEGEPGSEIPDGPTTAKVDMNFADGRWVVNGIFAGEGQPCELS